MVRQNRTRYLLLTMAGKYPFPEMGVDSEEHFSGARPSGAERFREKANPVFSAHFRPIATAISAETVQSTLFLTLFHLIID